MTAMLREFETPAQWMRRVHLVEVGAPVEDVERIMAAVIAIDPLAVGANYDSVAFQAASGTERYRRRDGAAAGCEEVVRLRAGPVVLYFEVEGDETHLGVVLEAIFQVHSYQKPTIRVTACLSARSKGLDDSANPHRWWNTTGDSKNAE